MHLCRNVCQKLLPLTHRGALLRNASVRQMSSSSVPGSSGGALPYYLVFGLACTGGGYYVYQTLKSDIKRSQERNEYLNAKRALQDYDDKGKVEVSAVAETIEEVVEAAVEEAASRTEDAAELEAVPTDAAELEAVPTDAAEQEAVPTNAAEQEQTAAEDEAGSAPTDPKPAPSTEASSEQVEPENIKSVGENLEDTTVVLEESSENITEEPTLAAEDWSELTARKPEETVVEGAPVPVAEESKEAVESEEKSASS